MTHKWRARCKLVSGHASWSHRSTVPRIIIVHDTTSAHGPEPCPVQRVKQDSYIGNFMDSEARAMGEGISWYVIARRNYPVTLVVFDPSERVL